MRAVLAGPSSLGRDHIFYRGGEGERWRSSELDHDRRAKGRRIGLREQFESTRFLKLQSLRG